MTPPNAIPIHSLQETSSLHFKIERLNYVNRYNPMRIHRHAYFEIFVFEKGGGHHLIDFEQIPIRSGEVHFVTPGQVHQVRRSPDSCGYVLIFSEEFYYLNREHGDFLFRLPFFYNNTGRPAVELSPSEFQTCLSLLGDVTRVFHSRSRWKESMLQSYLNILLCHCLDSFERQAPSPPMQNAALNLFHRFQTSVEKTYRSCHEVSAYARQLNVNPRQLNDCVKKYSGMSAVEYIHRRLALEARRLLMYTPAQVGEIGFELGFEDPAHFSRFVRNSTGRTPKEWREQVRPDGGVH